MAKATVCACVRMLVFKYALKAFCRTFQAVEDVGVESSTNTGREDQKPGFQACLGGELFATYERLKLYGGGAGVEGRVSGLSTSLLICDLPCDVTVCWSLAVAMSQLVPSNIRRY